MLCDAVGVALLVWVACCTCAAKPPCGGDFVVAVLVRRGPKIDSVALIGCAGCGLCDAGMCTGGEPCVGVLADELA